MGRAILVAALMSFGTARAVPPQVVPQIQELGAPNFSFPGSTSNAGGTTSGSYSGAWGTGNAYSTLMAQSYGGDAVAAAQRAGINPDTLAAFGQIESNFQNVGNSTSSAQGVWQITDATWNEYAGQLGLTSADRNDPAAQAAVASAIIGSYAQSVDQAVHGSATSAQVYGAYMFGPTKGAEIAAAPASLPLSNFVSPATLAANHMSGWSVGQYYSTVSGRMGSGASETVTGA